jgi:hypothetical protein
MHLNETCRGRNNVYEEAMRVERIAFPLRIVGGKVESRYKCGVNVCQCMYSGCAFVCGLPMRMPMCLCGSSGTNINEGCLLLFSYHVNAN